MSNLWKVCEKNLRHKGYAAKVKGKRGSFRDIRKLLKKGS
jgi:hypothetical protein